MLARVVKLALHGLLDTPGSSSVQSKGLTVGVLLPLFIDVCRMKTDQIMRFAAFPLKSFHTSHWFLSARIEATCGAVLPRMAALLQPLTHSPLDFPSGLSCSNAYLQTLYSDLEVESVKSDWTFSHGSNLHEE